MTKWSDNTIDKPKEKYNQNLPFKNHYNDWGFGSNDNFYSIPEENRDFRKHIENEIIMEEMKTQNILGQHITDEIDRNIENTDKRANEINANIDTSKEEIKDKIKETNDYVVNTVYPEIKTVETKVDNNKTLLDTIWNKVNQLRNAVIG